MKNIKDKWNKEKFSIYDSEEKTVLKIIQNIYNWFGDFLSMHDENTKELTDLIKNKTDITGNHLGKWQGLDRPTLSEEGMRATVEKMAYSSIAPYYVPEYLMTIYKKASNENLDQLNTVPVEMQGIAHLYDKKFFVTFSCMNKPLATSKTGIGIVDLSNKYTPTLERYAEIEGIFKANSCCVIGEKVYIAKANYYNTDGTNIPSNEIGVIDLNTFTLIETISIPQFKGVDYIASYKNEIYTMQGSKLYKYNGNSFDEVITLSPSIPNGMQGFDIYNDMIYINNSNSFMITLYDLKSGNKLKDISFANYSNVGHNFEYTADITIVDGDVYITPHQYGDTTSKKSNATNYFSGFSWYVNYICKIGLVSGNNASDTINSNYERKALYVNTDNPQNYYYCTGSSKNPLRLLSEYFKDRRYVEQKYILNTDNSNGLEYYGVLNLIDTSLNTGIKIKCYAIVVQNFIGALRNIEIDTHNLNIVPFTFSNSIITSLNLTVANNNLNGDISTSVINNHVALTHKATVSNSFIKSVDNSESEVNGIPFMNTLYSTVSHEGDKHIYTLKVGTSFSPRALLIQFKYKTTQSYSFIIPNSGFKGITSKEDVVFKDADGGQITISYSSTNKQVIFTGTNSSNIRQLIAIAI